MFESDQFDPEMIHADYEAIRSFLIDDVERRYETLPEASYDKLPERRLLSTLMERCGLSREEIEGLRRTDGEEFEKYLESVVKPEVERRAEATEPPQQQRLDPRQVDPCVVRPIPYSVLSIASDRALLERTLGDGDLHNPWAEKLSPNTWQKFLKTKIELKGKGSGLAGLGWPDCTTCTWQKLAWVFYFDPGLARPSAVLKPADYSWTCNPLFLLDGYVALFVSDDGFWESLYASLYIDVECILVPASGKTKHYPFYPIPKTAKRNTKPIVDWGGDDYTNAMYLSTGKKPTPHVTGDLGPHPADVYAPHWIICSFFALACVRGESYVIADLESGNFGVHCFDLTVRESGVLVAHPF